MTSVATIPVSGDDGYRYTFIGRDDSDLGGECSPDDVPSEVVTKFNNLAHSVYRAPSYEPGRYAVLREPL